RDIVGQPAEHIDVVVGHLDRQRAVGCGGADVVVGAQVGQVVVVLVGQIAGQRPFGAEHADPAVAAQEDRAIVQVAPQRVEGAGACHDPDRVDTHLGPEILVAAQHDGVAHRARFLVGFGGDLVFVVFAFRGASRGAFLGALLGGLLVDLVGGVFGVRLVVPGGVFFGLLGQFVGGLGGQCGVDLGGGDDLLDPAEHVVPAASDDLGDRIPALQTGFPGEV